MVRYLFYTIGDLTYQSPLVLCINCSSGVMKYLCIYVIWYEAHSSSLREAISVIKCRQKVVFCSFMTFVERMQPQSGRRVYEIENLSHNEPSILIIVLQNSKGYSTQLTINMCPSDN